MARTCLGLACEWPHNFYSPPLTAQPGGDDAPPQKIWQIYTAQPQIPLFPSLTRPLTRPSILGSPQIDSLRPDKTTFLRDLAEEASFHRSFCAVIDQLQLFLQENQLVEA